MRKFWIDTDAATDDALAIMMALKHKGADVVGISLVSGYRPVSVTLYNPFVICRAAGEETPPVYPGSDFPFGFVPRLPDVHVHGEDGLGDLPRPDLSSCKPESIHACDGILAAAGRYPGELEIVALGPLTNLALAFRKKPEAAKQLKAVYIMGGTGKGVAGNISPVAEANIAGDPEAAQAVLTSGAHCVLIGLDAAGGDMFYTSDDLDALASCSAGRWFVEASHDMIDFLAKIGFHGLSQPDPAAMGIALWPDLETEGNDAHCEVECRGLLTTGMVVEDTTHNPNVNCHVIHKMDGKVFKQRVLALLKD